MGVFTFNNLLSAVKTNGLSESFLPPMILNMSITASVIILFVLLARLALKKAPKIFSYALWAVVLFRLLCPVSITTDFSLLGLFDTPAVENTQHTTAVEYIPYDVVHTPNLEVQLPVPPAINDAVNDTLPQEHATLGADPLEGKFAIGSLIWLLGIGAMAIYSAVSYIRLRRKLVGSVLLRDNIYLADGIGSPFVMGFFRPKIYLPSALSEQEQGYIILHEQHHIRRGDHIIKALAFIALCIHWFNPLVWVAFVLSSKDMEMSCDEAVVKKLGEEIRADYSASLLSLATGRRIIAGTPLAFGEGDTKSRIKNMLNWKQPKAWLIVAAALVVVVIAVVCGTNANNRSKVKTQQTENGLKVELILKSPVRSYAVYEEIYQDGRLISGTPRLLDGFAEDDWSQMPRRQNLALHTTVGFDGAITAACVMEDGTEIAWETILPEHSYTGIASVVGAGNKEGTLVGESHEISAGDSVILCTVVMSKAPDGEVCVYRNGWSLAKANDTVVQYRLATSTETAEAFEDMPLDLAQTLYDLRVETLNDRDDPGAQVAIRALLDAMGTSDWGGVYTLEYYDLTRSESVAVLNRMEYCWPEGAKEISPPPYEKTALVIRFTEPVDPNAPDTRCNRECGETLLALIPDLEEVHFAYQKSNSPSRFYHSISREDGNAVAEMIGARNLEELAKSPRGIRALLEFLGWEGVSVDPEAVGNYGTAGDVAYYLELAAETEFQTMTAEEQAAILEEYEDLLDGYIFRARKSTDGKTAYIVGQYNGDPTQSPLHGMYSIDMYTGEEEYFRFLYREDEAETVETVVAANKTEFPPSAGYRIEDSLISWTDNSGCVLIQPKTNELFLDVPWNRYFYTPNGREYMVDAISRGIDICGRTDTFLYVYRISERFGEISERIALTEAEAQAILAEERVKITDGFGFSASLHIDGQTTYYNEREGIPQTVLDLAVEKCDYRFGDPSYITDTIREARLDCDWLDTALYADEADLPRLCEILKNAEHGYVGSCGYGAKLTLTFTGGEKLTVFKGCDGCDTIVFGSYGGYFLGEKENIEFWEMFGLDPDTKERIETNPAEEEESEISVTPVTHSQETLDTATYRVQSYLNAQFRNNPNTFRTDILYLEPDLAESARAAVRYFQRTDDLAVSDPTRAAQMIAVKAVYFQDWFLDTDSNQKDAGLQAKYFYVLPNEVVPDRWYIHDKADTSVPAGITSPADSSVVTSYMTIGLKSLGSSAEDAIAQLEAQDSFSASIARSNPVSIYNRSGDTPVLYIVTKDGHVGEMPLPYADEALNRAEAKNTHLDTNYNILCYDAEVEKTVRDQATGSPLSKAGKYRFIVDLESLTCAEIFTRTQEFTAEDVNFSGRALATTPDEMTYEERLSWVQAGPDYQQTHFTSLGQYAEGDGCVAYLGQWVGVPHMNQYRFDIRFADGTTAYLPLPDDGGWGAVPPDTMSFQNGKFIYEMTFPTTEVTNEGNTLIHLQGTYHYEVDLAAKTVSLTVGQ